MTIEEKLALWVKVTGIDPNNPPTSYEIPMDGSLSVWDIKKMNEQIKEALTYDDSGMFAEAYLQTYFQQFLEQRKISLFDLVTKPDHTAYIQDLKKLYDALQENHAEKTILEDAAKAMDFYDLPHDTLSVFTIAELRTSANRCMNGQLHTLQFATGKSAKDCFKMSKDIFIYEDINALLFSAASHQIDGVILAYIREREITDSYFAFVIKNGENLYLLTDMPHYAYPGQNRTIRCPGRSMHDRINCNYFPYQSVAKIDTSDLWNSGRYGTSESADAPGTGLQEYGRKKIGAFQDMDQEEMFWTVMMISLIRDKFYKEVPQYELNYVGAMIQNPQIEQKNALAIRSYFPTFALPDLQIQKTMEDGEKNLRNHDYLINRYKDRIDPEALNMIAGTGRFVLADQKYTEESSFYGHEPKHLLISFDPNVCGTVDELRKNQKYVERYNYSVQIREMLKKDFNDHWSEILRPVEEMVKNNIRNLCIQHLQGFLVEKDVPYSKQYTFDHWYGSETYHNNYERFRYGYDMHSVKADMRCYFTGGKPGAIIQITPQNMNELLQVCNCKKEDLPEELQHWGMDKEYYGNPSLERIDPLLWNVKDPWNELRFEINILLSKKEYLKLCEEAGVEKREFWKEIPPTCFRKNDDGFCSGVYHYEFRSLQKKMMKKCQKCKYWKQDS